jgi:acetyl esterase/lipase
MKRQYFCLVLCLLAGCGKQTSTPQAPASLSEARKGFQTKLWVTEDEKHPVPAPPPQLFKIVQYEAPVGQLAAYLSPDPGDGKKHPAIIWIHGGNSNSIGNVWSPRPRKNEQSASAYRQAGIIMMFPSLRGANSNPGTREGFLGEVDDVLAAADFLRQQPYIDPDRIYLGGHSTGGTLAMLIAESSPLFRAVFAYGPVNTVAVYNSDLGFTPFDVNDRNEVELRSPGYWLSSVQSPTWVIEGSDGNIDSLHSMAKSSRNSKVHFVEVHGADHFTVLAPTNALIAKKILADTGDTTNINLTAEEIDRLF